MQKQVEVLPFLAPGRGAVPSGASSVYNLMCKCICLLKAGEDTEWKTRSDLRPSQVRRACTGLMSFGPGVL